MGVYYFFYNISRNNIQNMLNAGGTFIELCFVSNLHRFSKGEQKGFFDKVIDSNGWDKTDILLAVPDYYEEDIFKYENGDIVIDNELKDNYFSDKNL